MSLSTCYLEYDRHVARLRCRRRRRAYAPTNNTASHDNHVFTIYGMLMGLRLAALAGAMLKSPQQKPKFALFLLKWLLYVENFSPFSLFSLYASNNLREGFMVRRTSLNQYFS